jgi:hypothetical protein
LAGNDRIEKRIIGEEFLIVSDFLPSLRDKKNVSIDFQEIDKNAFFMPTR